MSEWKPGDVAMVTWPNGIGQRAIVAPRPEAKGALQFLYTNGGFDMVHDLVDGSSVRPLAVIDPEDWSTVLELVQRIQVHHPGRFITATGEKVQAALREFARPTPAIEEPQGLGAVVEDAEGVLFVKWSTHHRADRNWKSHDQSGDYRAWPDVNAVRVLSEGVS